MTPGQESVTFDYESVFSDVKIVNDRPLAAGTYVKGEIVAYDTANDILTTFVAAGADGTGTARAVIAEDITLSSDGTGAIAFGEMSKAAITAIMAALTTPVTITDLMIADLDAAGVHLVDR